MKFAHLADSHLGYKQYGLLEREQDFYDVFDMCVDKIIDEKCDFVIHSGDLFEFSKPSPMALLRFQKAFLGLKEANIPVYAIAGNHDSVRRKGAVPPQILFKDLGLRLLSGNNPFANYNGILICGMQYVPKSNKDTLLDKFKDFEKEADKHVLSILVAHQSIDKYLPYNYELEIGDLPQNFDYYAMGHIHNYINDAYGKGRLVYPGSTEIWKSNEVGDYKKNGKGFVIVEVDVGEPVVRRVTVDLPRQFIKEYINYKELDSKLDLIKSAAQKLENKPIIEIIVGGADFSSPTVNDKVIDVLGECALRIRLTFNQKKDKEIEIDGDASLDARKTLRQILQDKYNNPDINDFGVELLNTLSSNNIDEAELVSEDFYTKNYASEEYIGLETQNVEKSINENEEDSKFIRNNKDKGQMNLFDSVGGA